MLSMAKGSKVSKHYFFIGEVILAFPDVEGLGVEVPLKLMKKLFVGFNPKKCYLWQNAHESVTVLIHFR